MPLCYSPLNRPSPSRCDFADEDGCRVATQTLGESIFDRLVCEASSQPFQGVTNPRECRFMPRRSARMGLDRAVKNLAVSKDKGSILAGIASKRAAMTWNKAVDMFLTADGSGIGSPVHHVSEEFPEVSPRD